MASSSFLTSLFLKISNMVVSEPGRIAIIERKRTSTYGQLKETIEAIVDDLRKARFKPGQRAGIFMSQSIEAYAAVYAVLLTGGTYVPLPVDEPVARMRALIENAELNVLLSNDESFALLQTLALDFIPRLNIQFHAHQSLSLKPLSVPEARTAPLYMLYTSGSTGFPKGVLIGEKSVENFVNWAGEYFSITNQDCFLGHTRLTFDLSVLNLFTPFFYGASVVIAHDSIDQMYPGELLRGDAEKAVTIALMVPRVTTHMLEAGQLQSGSYPSLRHILFCGENLLPNTVAPWLEAGAELQVHNLYGPTEATVACSCFTVPRPIAPGAVSIGAAIANMGLHVVHGDGVLLPATEDGEGELVISGVQVSDLGYWKNSAGGFFDDPQLGRSFRSGDRVKRVNGKLFWLSRIDDQVKIKGHRVELAEIEAVFASHPRARELFREVLCIFDEGTDSIILMVNFCEGAVEALTAELRAFARQQLPAYMRPARYVCVKYLPKTENGKVDRTLARDQVARILQA
jgi:amino acid adenylation domain-containing protein